MGQAYKLGPVFRGMQIGTLKVGPKLARVIIDSMVSNRKPKGRHVRRMVRDMLGGTFAPNNGETISFDKDWNLVNGQHRLLAIIASGKAQTFLVVIGVNPTRTHLTLDTGATRTFADTLHMNGYKNTALLGAVVRMKVKYDIGGLYSGNTEVSKTECFDLLELYEEDFVVAVKHATGSQANAFVKHTALGFVRFQTALSSPDMSDSFFGLLSSGEGLQSGSPVSAVRRLLIANKTKVAREHYKTPDQIAILAKAYLSFKAGRTMKSASIKGNEEKPSEF